MRLTSVQFARGEGVSGGEGTFAFYARICGAQDQPVVIPAKAGIQRPTDLHLRSIHPVKQSEPKLLDSRLRGNDEGGAGMARKGGNDE